MPLRYEDRTRRELEKIAAARNIKGFKNKSELIKKLRGRRKIKNALGSAKIVRGRAEKFERCVKSVKLRSSAYNPYAICSSSIYH